MGEIYGPLDRRIFTGVAMKNILGMIADHTGMAELINNLPIEHVKELRYTRREGIPLEDGRVGEKHMYTCILIQNNFKIHTLFSYESYDYTDNTGTEHIFSIFVPPIEETVSDFLIDTIIY